MLSESSAISPTMTFYIGCTDVKADVNFIVVHSMAPPHISILSILLFAEQQYNECVFTSV